MSNFFNFEQLYFLLKFTDAQKETCSQTLSQAFDACEYHDALKILYCAGVVKTHAPDIASACIDAVITEPTMPKEIALIICELATVNIFSTLERTHIHLTRIKDCPKKSALHVAFSWLNTLGLPDETIHHYYLPDTPHHPNYEHPVFDQIDDCLRMIITADYYDLATITLLTQLLKTACSLPYDTHIELINKIFSHQNIYALHDAFEILYASKLFNPFTSSSELCLNTILQDQNTPEITADILQSIMPSALFASEELTRSYCSKVIRYPEKAYLVAITSTLEKELEWSPEPIQACILEVCDIQKSRPEVSSYVQMFLTFMGEFNRVVSEYFYPRIAPLLNPNNISEFLNLTSLLQNTDQRLDDALDNIEHHGTTIRARLNGSIPLSFPIMRICCEASASLNNLLSEKMERHLPLHPSIRKQVHESNGHALYCGSMMRTSHLFFGCSRKAANLIENNDVENNLQPQALIINN
jgi:hypothetical protein